MGIVIELFLILACFLVGLVLLALALNFIAWGSMFGLGYLLYAIARNVDLEARPQKSALDSLDELKGQAIPDTPASSSSATIYPDGDLSLYGDDSDEEENWDKDDMDESTDPDTEPGTEPCGDCQGTGVDDYGDACATCGGEGKIEAIL